MLSEYEMSCHLAKKGFMSNYLLWHQHGDESDENDDVDQMDDMLANIGRGYDLDLRIHYWRCKISICSLPPQKKKCTMALI
jgi:hypothetical protein